MYKINTHSPFFLNKAYDEIEVMLAHWTDLMESPNKALCLLSDAALQPPFGHPFNVFLLVPLIDWYHLTIWLQLPLSHLQSDRLTVKLQSSVFHLYEHYSFWWVILF